MILRKGGNWRSFWCPGCNEAHSIAVMPGEHAGPVWGFNGNEDAPTFTPSVLVRQGHYVPGHQGLDCWCNFAERHPDMADRHDYSCGVCHSFVTDGRIQFLNDCTHALAGQTVDLPHWPGHDRPN